MKQPAHPHPRSPRGLWTILAVFALGGAVLAGLFLWPRPKAPSAPPGVPFGVPDGGLRVVVYRAATPDGRNLSAGEIAGDLHGHFPAPGLLILLDIDPDEAPALAGLLGMRESYDPRLYQRVRRPGGGGPMGLCVLSPHPLYEAAPLKANRREALGAIAVAVVGGRKFLVAGVALADGPRDPGAGSLIDFWIGAGSPPALVAGDIGPGASQSLAARGFEPAGFSLMASPDWRVEADPVWPDDPTRGTGHSFRLRAGLAPSTRPTTGLPATRPEP